MSRAQRLIAVFGAAACLALLGVSCGDDDGAAGENGGGSTDSQDIEKVAMALTGGVDFDDGMVVAALLPDPTNDTVKLDESAVTLQLEPGGAEILPLEVTNPDSADAQVEAVLLQFEGADEHIEVSVEGTEDETQSFELPFTVDGGICDALCNEVVKLKLLQAVRLTNKEVSQRLESVLELDCSKDGDPDKCESDEPAGGSSGGGNEPDAGGSSGGGGSTNSGRADTFATALNAANTAKCQCMPSGSSMCDALYPRASIQCIKDAIDDASDTDSVNGVNALTTTLRTSLSACRGCDMAACPATLLADHLADLPTGLSDTILECAGGSLPPGADAGM